MSKVIIALIFAAFVGLSFQCSKPTGRCSTPCSTNFPSNGKCNYAPMIARHEGCCECTYLDSLGKPTIGIGYLMVPSRASQLQSVGANYESLVTGQSQLNMEQITQLFNIYVQSSIQVAQKTYSNWNKLCCNVEQALVDIIYDLNNGISAFHTFNAAINSENWTGAAAALQNSLFCKQVGQRCTDDANLIKQGCPKTSSTPSKSGNPNAGNNSAPKNNEESKASSSKASSSKTSAQASNPNSSQQSGSQQSGSQQSGSQQSGSQQSGSQQSGSQQSGSQQSGSASNSQQSGSASNSQQSGSASNSQQSGSGSASNSGSQQSGSGSAASSSAKSSKSSSSSTRQH